jgi:2-polyprenyl-3-methyl-5-hydroxy-6-metoxy-1,4-benzoquinol methylase
VNHIFNEEYYATGCGPHYSEFQKDFERMAGHIVQDFHPGTVLDAGCAWGYLVAALRDKGVEAYGIDISEYAIGKVREDVTLR